MSQFVDWEYYSSLHSKIAKDDFDKKESMAENEVRSVIGPIRWATITADTFGYAQLQDCICNVIDKMASDEKSGKGKGIFKQRSVQAVSADLEPFCGQPYGSCRNRDHHSSY